MKKKKFACLTLSVYKRNIVFSFVSDNSLSSLSKDIYFELDDIKGMRKQFSKWDNKYDLVVQYGNGFSYPFDEGITREQVELIKKEVMGSRQILQETTVERFDLENIRLSFETGENPERRKDFEELLELFKLYGSVVWDYRHCMAVKKFPSYVVFRFATLCQLNKVLVTTSSKVIDTQ